MAPAPLLTAFPQQKLKAFPDAAGTMLAASATAGVASGYPRTISVPPNGNNGGSPTVGGVGSRVGNTNIPLIYEQLHIHNYRGEVMQAAQRRDVARLRRLVLHLVHDARLEAAELDCCLALHHVVWTPELNDLTDLLLSVGCDPYFPDANGDTPIHYCVRGCNLKFLRMLFSAYGVSIFSVLNNNHFNLILTAAAEAPDERAYEILNLLEWLHLSGMSIESHDAHGLTPLMWACQRGSIVLVQWCLSRGADLSRRDHNGRTSLMMACLSGDEEVVRLICEKGAINLLECESNDDPESNTALKLCWNKGHFFLSLSLRQWYFQRRAFGCMRVFKNVYAWYYWFLVSFNFIIVLAMTTSLSGQTGSFWRHAILFLSFFILSQIFWLLAFGSNPGWVKTVVIPDQSYRCSSSLRADLAQRPVFSYRYSCSSAKLQMLERESAAVSAELTALNRHYGSRGTYTSQLPPPDAQKKYESCSTRIHKIREKMLSYLDRVGQERQLACPKSYVSQVMEGNPRRVCLTCRIVKPFRAHHCSDCGHCVRRFDHHCIWIDNCVGEGNQRSFLCFLFFLSLTILYFWILVGSYFAQELSRKDAHSLDLLAQPLFYITLFNSLLNLPWAGFAGYLFMRTFKSMCTNITFYEYLKKPSHIQKRFKGRVHGCCWDATDLSFRKVFRNIYSYCLLSSANDALDYIEVAGDEPATTSQSLTNAIQMPLMQTTRHATRSSPKHHHHGLGDGGSPSR